jgi:hypothetical protein
MNVYLSLPHLYTKFHGQIHLTLAVTKKPNFGDLDYYYLLNFFPFL